VGGERGYDDRLWRKTPKNERFDKNRKGWRSPKIQPACYKLSPGDMVNNVCHASIRRAGQYLGVVGAPWPNFRWSAPGNEQIRANIQVYNDVKAAARKESLVERKTGNTAVVHRVLKRQHRESLKGMVKALVKLLTSYMIQRHDDSTFLEAKIINLPPFSRTIRKIDFHDEDWGKKFMVKQNTLLTQTPKKESKTPKDGNKKPRDPIIDVSTAGGMRKFKKTSQFRRLRLYTSFPTLEDVDEEVDLTADTVKQLVKPK
jgi:hypothetical protein